MLLLTLYLTLLTQHHYFLDKKVHDWRLKVFYFQNYAKFFWQLLLHVNSLGPCGVSRGNIILKLGNSNALFRLRQKIRTSTIDNILISIVLCKLEQKNDNSFTRTLENLLISITGFKNSLFEKTLVSYALRLCLLKVFYNLQVLLFITFYATACLLCALYCHTVENLYDKVYLWTNYNTKLLNYAKVKSLVNYYLSLLQFNKFVFSSFRATHLIWSCSAWIATILLLSVYSFTKYEVNPPSASVKSHYGII